MTNGNGARALALAPLLLVSVAVQACTTPAGPTCTTTIAPTTDTQALRRALAASSAGSTVCLDDDPAQEVDFPGQQYVGGLQASGVTVQALGNATMGTLALVNSSGLTVRGLRLRPQGNQPGVRVNDGAHDIDLDQLDVDSAAGQKGIVLTISQVGAPRIYSVRITGSTIRHTAGDAIGIYSADAVTVTGNTIEDIQPERGVPGDHVDGVQAVGPITGLTVKGNRISDPTITTWGGPYQAVIAGGAGLTADVVIADNQVGPWPGTGVIVGDRDDTGNLGTLGPVSITGNSVTCANGGVVVKRYNPASEAPTETGNTFTYYRACP